MCKILLPIKQKYVQDLLSGKKIFELRRQLPKRKVDEILIYETSPTSKIVGSLKVKVIHSMSKERLWTKTKTSNSLSRSEFYDYFSNKSVCHAYEISEYKEFKKPIPKEFYGIRWAPQGFIYIN